MSLPEATSAKIILFGTPRHLCCKKYSTCYQQPQYSDCCQLPGCGLASIAREPFWRPRAGLALASRLGARLPSTRLFASREPVAPWRGAPLGPSSRARTPFWGPRARCSLAWGASVAISSGSHPVLGPRARRSLARGPSGAIPAGSQICGYEVCRAGGGGARGAEPASGWRRDVFSSLGGP